MEYDSFVQEKLAGRAEVFFAEDNGRFVQYTLRTLSNWAAKNQWPSDIDVVHWNNGLWNCLHLISANISCADGEAAGESIKPENTESKNTYENDPLTPPDFFRYSLGDIPVSRLNTVEK